MRRIPFLLLLPLLLLLGAAVASAQEAPKANARLLLRIASGASHRLIQAGQGRLGQDARTVAFWQALLRMEAQIQQVGNGLRTRDLAFFQALRNGTAALAELQVSWSLTGRRDPAIEQDLATLATAYDRLRNRYGPEWVRYQTGQPLSEDERLRFARMRAEQSYLAGRIEPLRDQAKRAGDHTTAEELTLLLLQIHGIATAPPTLGDFLDASVAADSIRGGWYGTRAAHGRDEEGWAEADEVVSGITTNDAVGFVFTTDLNAVQDWSFAEEETEIPQQIAEAEADPGIEPGQMVDLGAELPDESDLPPLPDEEPAEEGLAEDPGTTEPAIELTGEIEEEDLSTDAVPGEEAPKACLPEDLDCVEPLPEPAPETVPPPSTPSAPAVTPAPPPPVPPAPAPPIG